MKEIIAIKSVKELCNMNLKALEKYKTDVAKAEKEASTDFEREAYVNQLLRVNTAINEKKLATYLEYQDKKFKAVIRDIHESVIYAEGLRGTILCENKSSQDTNTGTSSKLVVATAECPNIEER
jgi:hypothetical protein